MTPRSASPWPVYAERPGRRARQVLADLAVAAWVLADAWLATALREVVLRLQGPAQGLAAAGQRVRGTFDGAAGAAHDLPFVGSGLAGALGGGSRAGQSLVDAGGEQVAAVGALATGLWWTVLLGGVGPVVATWLVLRGRWVLRAHRTRAVDDDLLALRALVRGAPERLARVAPDAAGAWRRGEPTAVRRLADLELARVGLRSPDGWPGDPPPARTGGATI